MRHILITAAALSCLMLMQPGALEADVPATMTVGAVRQMLVEAMNRLDGVLLDATQNVKAAGNSLEANARGVVSDIDHRLGNKLAYTFDRLDASERHSMDDAYALVGQIDTAAQNLLQETEGAARRILGDADIVAYDAMYSLPCRDQVPRVVYVTPDTYYEGHTIPEVSMHGNFLDIGPEPAVTIDGKAAKLISRSATEVRLALPAAVAKGIASPHSVGLRFRPTVRYRSCVAFGLIPWTSQKPLAADLGAPLLLQPKTTVTIAATLSPVLAQRETGTWSFGDNRGTDGDCERHFDATLAFCIPDSWGGRLTTANPYSGPGINSKNCNSDIEGVDVVGDRCIRVRAHIGGCGADHLPLGIKNCKGNGWLNYGITLNGERFVPANGPESNQGAQGVIPVQTNFVFVYRGDLGGQTPSAWHYRATVSFFRGDPSVPIKTVEISDTAAVIAGVVSRLGNATLAIDVDQVVASLFPP